MSLETMDAGVELRADPARVVADLFVPGESTPGATSRTAQVTARVLGLPPEAIAAAVRQLGDRFGSRHIALLARLRANAAKVHPGAAELDDGVRLVLGAAFTAEYAIEGAALCNPSAVIHPDQAGIAPGALRVALSMRSIGEGHLSAISFCTAVIGPGRSWRFDQRQLPLARAAVTVGVWDRDHLRRALHGQLTEIARAVIERLPARCSTTAIESAIAELPEEFLSHPDSWAQVEAIRRIGRSAYEARFEPGSALSARVLLPAADEERHGVEDARFVRFVDDDGKAEYRASYTAYDGRTIASRLIVTDDLERFWVHRLTGAAARTKGMAFFPRRVGGRLLALARTDGERISLVRSDDGLHWGHERPIHAPQALWEIVQSGNCGSPIETDRGWLVLTHGVGPMRRYSIGAILLDLDDPVRVIARLEAPLLEPGDSQRDGYVPNVVYSCGGIVHEGVLWLPYGIGDQHIRVASVAVDELLDAMSPMANERSG